VTSAELFTYFNIFCSFYETLVSLLCSKAIVYYSLYPRLSLLLSLSICLCVCNLQSLWAKGTRNQN